METCGNKNSASVIFAWNKLKSFQLEIKMWLVDFTLLLVSSQSSNFFWVIELG